MPPALAVAAAVVGAGATVAMAVNQQKAAKSAAKQQQTMLDQQKEDIAAQEAARKKEIKELRKQTREAREASVREQENTNALNAGKTETGASISLGSGVADDIISNSTASSVMRSSAGTPLKSKKKAGGVSKSYVGGL